MNDHKHEGFIPRAITIDLGDTLSSVGAPFAAVVGKDGTMMSKCVDMALSHSDPTSHGEPAALCDAVRDLGTCDPAGYMRPRAQTGTLPGQCLVPGSRLGRSASATGLRRRPDRLRSRSFGRRFAGPEIRSPGRQSVAYDAGTMRGIMARNGNRSLAPLR